MKTSELNGAALDWAVAKCEGTLGHYVQPNEKRRITRWEVVPATRRYSTNWAHGGPIIEREEFTLSHSPYEHVFYGRARPWCAEKRGVMEYGPTPLIAAMRCYVASKLGDTVDVPSELVCMFLIKGLTDDSFVTVSQIDDMFPTLECTLMAEEQGV